jgi:mRNA-degrading endonuclease RelE of RelBE toxin-antitoxin system
MRFTWRPAAREQLRAIGRENALRILEVLTRYGRGESADVKTLHGEFEGQYRIRAGDYRAVFRLTGPSTIEVLRVAHRSEAYR